MNKNNFLEQCLYELLKKVDTHSIYFKRDNTLEMMDLPDSNIRKNPVKRYINSVNLVGNFTGHDEEDVIVDVITPPRDKRGKYKISSYCIHNFDEPTKQQILLKSIQNV